MVKLQGFSDQQKRVLRWWRKGNPDSSYDAVICDGAVRSGKTLSMSLSFVLWALSSFRGGTFAFCGKTILSVRRNVVSPLLPILRGYGFSCGEDLRENRLYIRAGKSRAVIYLFGGKDEAARDHIQGLTLCGVLFDEAALMPRAFIEQAVARCSAAGSRFWFNCNPEHPYHWFYREWIQKAEARGALYLHFTMTDNPSLSPAVRQRYETLYTGSFYERCILGRWSSAEGVVYPMFSRDAHVVKTLPDTFSRYFISCDYGTVNPCSMGLWGLSDGVWYRMREYYHDSKQSGRQLTDEEYYEALCGLAGEITPEAVIVDPSAASFIQCIRRRNVYRAVRAENDVVNGIRRVSGALRERSLRFHRSCEDSIREFSLYIWADSANNDTPRKEHDHAMDDIRYFVNTVLHGNDGGGDGFFACSVER